MVEHPINLFNPNCPKGNAMENVVNLDFLIKFLRSSFPKKSLLPTIIFIVDRPNPPMLMHDESGSPPSTPCLNVIPKLVLGIQKNTLLGNQRQRDVGPPFIDSDGLILDGPHESNFFPRVSWVPNLRPIERVVPWKIALPLVSCLVIPIISSSNLHLAKLGGLVEEQ